MNSTTWSGLGAKIVLGTFLILAMAGGVIAQSTATINGTVKDQTGAPVRALR